MARDSSTFKVWDLVNPTGIWINCFLCFEGKVFASWNTTRILSWISSWCCSKDFVPYFSLSFSVTCTVLIKIQILSTNFWKSFLEVKYLYWFSSISQPLVVAKFGNVMVNIYCLHFFPIHPFLIIKFQTTFNTKFAKTDQITLKSPSPHFPCCLHFTTFVPSPCRYKIQHSEN